MREIRRSPSQRPLLLVSVRSASEAAAALAGGCDVLDMKEPARGSLGSVEASTAHEIAEWHRNAAGSLPLSMALGELTELLVDNSSNVCIPPGVDLVKLGLAGVDPARWRSQWLETRCRIDAASGRPLRWVAVAYADWRLSQAPNLEVIADAALETGCSGLLIDTFGKQSGSLLDWLKVDQLRRIARRLRAADLFLALAGSLRRPQLPELIGSECDLIAVRTAACQNQDRQAEIDAAAVAQLVQDLDEFRPAAESLSKPSADRISEVGIPGGKRITPATS